MSGSGAGHEHVFEAALTFGQAIFGHLRKIGAASEISSMLVFPGEVDLGNDGAARAHSDELLDELLD